MSDELHSIWSVLALDGVGEAIGDPRPIFAVASDGRLLHFANAAGARFLGLDPAAALDTRITLEPRLHDRLVRFAGSTAPGGEARELLRFFDGLRSSLVSVGFRRLATDVVLVAVDNTRAVAADADPAASLAAIATRGGLVALFDGEGEVVAALGDHAALDGVQEDIEAALDSEADEAIFERRVAVDGRAHDIALVRLGSGDRPRRLLRVGPAIAVAPQPKPLEARDHSEARPVEEPAAITPEPDLAPVETTTPPDHAAATTAPAALAALADSVEAAPAPTPLPAPPAMPSPELPLPEVPAAAFDPDEATAELARAVAVVTGDEITDETAEEPAPTTTEADLALPATVFAPIAPALAEMPVPPMAEPVEASTKSAEPEATPAEPEATPAGPTAAASEPESEQIESPVAAAVETEDETTADGFRFRPLGRAVKFVWQMDADRRFTLVSDELAAAVGPKAAAVIGRSWAEVAADFGLDPEGRVAGALERRDTWSGRTVLWPIEGEALRLPVDLAALPAFDRGRVFAGYRGFGTVRGDEAIPDPTATGLRLGAPAPADLDVAPPSAEHAETPLAAEVEDVAAPIHPDDIEAPQPEAPHHLPDLDEGEAAFAGEICPPAEPAPATEPAPVVAPLHTAVPIATAPTEAPASVAEPVHMAETIAAAPTAAPIVLPDFWLDDELALAMATLPACDEGEDTTEATPSTASDEAPAVETEEPTPAAGFALLPPASPLALEADEIRFETTEPAPETETAEAPVAAPVPLIDVTLHPVAETGASSDAETALAEAPAALRTAVARIAERAAEHEPRIVLPAHPEAEPPAAPHVPEPPIAGASHAVVPSEAPLPTETPAAEPHPAVVALAESQVAETMALEPRPAGATATDVHPAETISAEPHPSEAAIPQPASAEVPPPPPATVEPPADGSARIVALAAATRPPAEATRLSPPERVAFRQIAEALGARIEGEERRPAPATAPAATPMPDAAATQPAAPNSAVDTRLLDRLPGAVAVVKDDDLVYGNDAFLRLLGYADLAALEAAGGLDALFAGEHVARRWDAAPDGGRPVPVLAHDGRVIPVDATVATVPWVGGSALMLTLAEVAVTPRAETPAPTEAEPAAAALATTPAPRVEPPAPASAEVAPPRPVVAPALPEATLDARLAELEAIIDTATDGVLMLDGEGTILSANHAAEALFGADRQAMIGRSLADRLAPESRRAAMDYLDGLARNGVASVLNDGREVIGVVEQGGLIPLFMTIGRISAEPARKYCAVLRDITQWKKSEEDLTAARRRAEEASVHKSDFLAKISHEIRTPLNAIIGFSEVMMDERFGPVGNERYKDYLRDIHSSGSHIMSLINDLLDLSKVEAGKMDLRFEAVTLADIVAECVAMMQPQANRERIIIRSSLPAGVPPVVADPRSVRQVVLNLLSNAIKFTPSGGQVIVSTTLEDSGEVVLRVRDTGYGMTEKELQTAMEPFRQLHTTRSRGGGTGLGLPLTKALVEANRAVFRIDSTVGQGTLVTVAFPVTRVLAS